MPDTDIFKNNSAILAARFPKLAAKLGSLDINKIAIGQAGDEGIFYAVEQNGKWIPLSNFENPVAAAQRSINIMEARLSSGLSPAVLVGLYPGYILDTVFKHFNSRLKYGEPFRHIYVIVDSILCLAGWLKASDRTEILGREEVSFYWHEDVNDIVELCEKDEQRSHLFIPLSSLPEDEVNKIIQPLAELYLKRERETQLWKEENKKYYDEISDSELAGIIQGKAGRRPRLLMPTHSSSTVVQYSSRDTCGAFEKQGWDVRILKMDRDLSPWRMVKTIYEFKPDIMIFINHLRTEDDNVSLYPDNMMFITWIQDTVPSINRKDSAGKWNANAEKRNRDIFIGYINMLKQYGYLEDRLSFCPMIVNTELFRPRELKPEQKDKYGCDICFASNQSRTTEEILKEHLLPLMAPKGFTLEHLKEIHDRLWEHYRSGKVIISAEKLNEFILEKVPSFEGLCRDLDPNDRDNMIDRIFWNLNDLIYRNIVLEWVDEMGLKLHIYGKGWEEHPRFKKYARGPIGHGEELSIAYQAAKYCLHLNAVEGQHQRLYEIIASGGTYLKRHDKDDVVSDEDLRLAQIRFLINSYSGNEILPEHEEVIIHRILSGITILAMAREHFEEAPWETIYSELDKTMISCLYENMNWLINNDGQGFQDKKSLRLLLKEGKRLKYDVKKLLDLINNVFVDNIKRIIIELQGASRQNFLFKLTDAQKFTVKSVWYIRTNRSFLEEAMERPELCILPYLKLKITEKFLEESNYAQAESVFNTIDHSELNPVERKIYLRIAFFLNIVDRKKAEGLEDEIYSMYEDNREMNSFFISSAWRAFNKFGDYEKIINYGEKDYRLKRLSDGWKRQLALAYAYTGRRKKSLKLIKEIYHSRKNELKDCYSMLARICFLPDGKYDDIVDCCRKDIRKNRITKRGMAVYIFALQASGRTEEAERNFRKFDGDRVELTDDIFKMASVPFLDGRVDIVLNIFDFFEHAPDKYRSMYCTSLLVKCDYEAAVKSMDEYGVPYENAVLSVIDLWGNSKIPLPDLKKFIGLLDRKKEKGARSLTFYRAAIACYGHLREFEKAENLYLSAVKDLNKRELNKLIFNMAMSFLIYEQDSRAVKYIRQIDFDSLSARGEFLASAMFFASGGNFDLCVKCLEQLYLLKPFYVSTNPNEANMMIFFGIIALKTGNVELAEKCLSYARKYASAYKIHEPLLKRLSLMPPCQPVSIPDFVFSWDDAFYRKIAEIRKLHNL